MTPVAPASPAENRFTAADRCNIMCARPAIKSSERARSSPPADDRGRPAGVIDSCCCGLRKPPSLWRHTIDSAAAADDFRVAARALSAGTIILLFHYSSRLVASHSHDTHTHPSRLRRRHSLSSSSSLVVETLVSQWPIRKCFST